MPAAGVPNNPGGANAFSGPLGQKEPEYGAVAQEQVLTKAAPGVAPVEEAPRRAQRRAVKGAPAQSGGQAAAPPGLHSAPNAVAGADAQQTAFWFALLHDPGASPLVREYAMKALNGR